MAALTIHMKKIAVPFMTPRTWEGNISPSMVHTTVPLVDWTTSMNTAMSTSTRYGAQDGGVVPSAMCEAMAW